VAVEQVIGQKHYKFDYGEYVFAMAEEIGHESFTPKPRMV